MRYTLIKGEFHIHYPDDPRRGPEPDGDTLKFDPDDRSLVEGLERFGGMYPDFNSREMINIRFEGIDALETHFSGKHQNMQWANAARDYMLQKVGFGNVTFFANSPAKVETVQHHPKRGYILANGLDGHGRILAFVYSGNTNRADGLEVHLDVPELDKSVNAKLLLEGLVYPAFYTTLPSDLIERFRELTILAYNADKGLWPEDTANPIWWQQIPDMEELESLVMWPKLFRRLVRYFSDDNTGLGNFDAWLRADPRNRDDRVLLPEGELGNIHDLVETDGDWILMNRWPEDIVIMPDDA